MNTFTRALALPLLSAGILGGALGLAGTASAQVTTTTTNGDHAIVATPDTKAPSAASMLPYSHRHHHYSYWR